MPNLEKITNALEEMRALGKSSSCVDPENSWCVTFEMRDATTKGSPFWIQVQEGTLNMQYLDEDEPIGRMQEEVSNFPSDFTLISWGSAVYATFQMSQLRSSELAGVIDRIAREYFGLQSEYDVSYDIEYH